MADKPDLTLPVTAADLVARVNEVKNDTSDSGTSGPGVDIKVGGTQPTSGWWLDNGAGIPVTANVPTADDTANTITWTPKAGVEYVIGGQVRTPPYSVGDVTTTVVVTAQATSGYTLTGTSSWSFDFTGSAPADTTPPNPGTLAVTGSGDAGSTRTLTVTGASDAGSGLHAQPYRFSTNGGTTWSTYQTSNAFTTGALTAGTYQPRVMVRDAAGNTATASAADFTIAAVAGTITDTFDRADGVINGTTTTTGGKTWQGNTTNPGNMTSSSSNSSIFIVSNRAANHSTVQTGNAVLPLGVTNVRAKIDYGSFSGTGGPVTLTIAAQPGSGSFFHGLGIRYNPNDGVFLIRGDGASNLTILGPVYTAAKNVDIGTLEIEYDGTTVRGWWNGNLVHSAAVSGMTGTYLGLSISGSTAGQQRYVDDLLVTLL